MNILIAKKPSPEFFALLSRAKVFLHFIEVLKIVPLEITFPPLSGYGVVSSENAVQSIQKKQISLLPGELYCVGEKSAIRLRELNYLGTLHVYSRMSLLCDELFAQKPATIHYFCGREHRRELPDAAGAHPEFSLICHFCYTSQQLFPKLSHTDYDAVCLFSPRGAESLFKENKFRPDQRFYCIGQVTAEAVQGLGYLNTICSDDPNLTTMARTILEENYA